MRAIDATRKPVLTIEASATLEAAAQLMHDASVGALVVTDGGDPVGIVTDRDIVVRGVRRGTPSDARIDSVMTRGVVAMDADADLREALGVLRAHEFRRLPLTREGKLVAVLSTDDVLIEIVNRLIDVVHPITGQVLHREPERDQAPVRTSS